MLIDEFAEWIDKAVVGDVCLVEAHPRTLQERKKAARGIAARHHVEVRISDAALDTEFRVEVLSLDPHARLEPREHAKALFSTAPKPEPGKTLLSVRCKAGRKHELLRHLQRLYSQAGYDIHDFKHNPARGEFMLRFTRRFGGLKACSDAPAPLLQSPDDLEAKGLLRLDSSTMKTQPSGPQDGAGEFSAGGRR